MSSLSDVLAGAQKPIVVFSYGGCPYCRMVEKALDQASMPYQVIDFDADLENGESIHQEITKKHKHRSVPAVFVKCQFVGGCNDGPEPWMGTMPLLKSGKLAAML
mmetsp:Transcript_19782/g.37745  ORF Transcript_19782/g.37745 Transcript_19782/m.37745 type:complete len:105 (+) Transcript_19782:88-402(+)|eukprot:CAMPEP_0114227550 /NCGR_PEP_ID=MMETSP0058-20121206/1852_1 /TAXON_ID=36894 /ORGANISM="Pyramimonas parkeae, CCMP726" /LENGTH=104 /DNA_ID=CAMNT_0001338403 /DNA_START=63 /DNA_END=377 /DNA_ORIENTATION=+